MPRKKSPKFSRLKAEEWTKYVAVKTGAATYKVDRPAPPEDKERYACGVIPFGSSPPTTAYYKKTSISRAAAKFCATMTGDAYAEFGIEKNSANTTAPPSGWYPALCFITLAAATATPTATTSQLTGRSYKKYRTRSATITFGRRTKITKDATTGVSETTIADVDFADSKGEISVYVNGAWAESIEVKSLSFENEIWQPQAEALPSLSSLESPGAITAF